VIVDYSKYPLGSKPAAFVIRLCPVCGKHGEQRPARSKKTPWLFVHSVDATATRLGSDVRIVHSCKSETADAEHKVMKQTGML